MSSYVCAVCGYVYEEAKGNPEKGVAPGTLWEDVPNDWVCPLCGAGKSEFKKQEEFRKESVGRDKKPETVIAFSEGEKGFTPLEMSVLCANLARGLEKQYKQEESDLLTELSEYFKEVSPPAENPSYEKLADLVGKDLDENYPYVNNLASEAEDRGTLRALTWSEKVTRMQRSLLEKYEKEGEAAIEGKNIHLCTICGFIHVGGDLSEICPVCKVPNWKFEKMEGGQ